MSPLPEAAQRAIAQLRRTGGTQLSLTHLGLERFPVEVLELTQLTALKVHGEFTRVPQEITRLSALERLELGGRVGRLPVAMAKMPALRSLTQGRAKFSRKFVDFQATPPDIQQNLIANYKEEEVEA